MACKLPKKPLAVIMDLRGVLANKNFELLSSEKKSFYRSKIDKFVVEDSLWGKNKRDINLKHIYKMARVEQAARIAAATLIKNEPILPNTGDLEDMQEALRKYVVFGIDSGRKDRSTGLFLEQMQIWGYDVSLLKTPVYPDVLPFMKKLKELGIAMCLTGGSDKTFEKVMSQTSAGNLFPYFYTQDGESKGNVHIDYNPRKPGHSFAKLDLLSNKDALYITHSSISANKALDAGIPCVIVVRHDFDPDWRKRVQEGGSTAHAVGSLPIIQVTDNAKFQSDPAEDDMTENDADEGLALHPVTSKITADDWKKFTVITSLADLQFPGKVKSPSPKSPAKPKRAK